MTADMSVEAIEARLEVLGRRYRPVPLDEADDRGEPDAIDMSPAAVEATLAELGALWRLSRWLQHRESTSPA